jgi:hypothetical protein
LGPPGEPGPANAQNGPPPAPGTPGWPSPPSGPVEAAGATSRKIYGASSGLKYNLTLAIMANNAINHVNYAAPSSDFSSRYFCEYRSLARANRRLKRI